jgi:hypothetical protein
LGKVEDEEMWEVKNDTGVDERRKEFWEGELIILLFISLYPFRVRY